MGHRVLSLCLLILGFSLVLDRSELSRVMASTAAFSSETQRGRADRGEGEDRPSRGEEEGIKPYEEVITEEAESDEGVFTVHRIKEKVYYEIPAEELGREFLWVSRVARNTLGAGYGGQKLGSRVVRWDRHGDRVLLRNVSYSVVADRVLPIAQAVEASNNQTILMAFDIKALGADDAPVIDVTPLFSTEVTEFSLRSRLQARGFDAKRSFIERVISFPTNIEVRATHTFTRPPDTGDQSSQRRPPTPRTGRSGMEPGSATVLMHFSMVRLPEDPMMPRLYDERVGYFSVLQTDFGREEHRAVERRYITRWRLEKKDPAAEVSEPLRPIVYWVDRATPARWVPFVKQGVEDWQPAFEAAGFKNAIIAREAPSPAEDPDWHPEDARYSVIRWLPSTIENASGPHVHDPRTGEILESDIQFYHNVQNLVRSWYFLQVAPLDPRARKLPLPDGLMGELLRYVVAHEVGHTLGFQHNMKASSTYPLEKVRDREWLRKMSHTPTLMDYSRFNYVAQPEDGIDPADLIPKIGPYDVWATMWGYQPIAEAKTPDDEREQLNQWILEQDETAWLRFSTAGSNRSDPGELTEAVGDADAVEATRLGLKNLERVADLLLEAASTPGKAWGDLEELYGGLLGQWVREMNHVVALVGGFHSRQVHAGQDGVRFEPVPGRQQAEAVHFLNQNAFATPEFVIRAEILRRIEPMGVLSRIRNAQRSVLDSLLNPDRFVRLVEQEALDPQESYRPAQFLVDLRKGIWRELSEESIRTDAFRRNLQRVYLELLDSRLNGSQAVTDDMRAFLRGQLTVLDMEIAGSAGRTADQATRFHLEDSRHQIARILDPKFARPAADSSSAGSRRGSEDSVGSNPDENGCWPELIIRPD